MRFLRHFILIFTIFTLLGLPLDGQVKQEISLAEYLERVRVGNLEYAAERLEIDIADANIITASLFDNPSIEFSYYNNEIRRMQLGEGVEFELSQSFSPGKRRAAINVAKGERECAVALLTDFYRELRGEAAKLWLEGVKLRHLCEIKQGSFNDQRTLIKRDSLSRGSQHINDLDILQNRIETCLFKSEMLDIEQELREHSIAMTELCGINTCDTLFSPLKKNITCDRKYDLNQLVTTALDGRADMVAAASEVKLAKLEIKSAKAERIPEFELFVGYQINEEALNIEAPTPRHTGVEFGISFPIPIFNLNRGNIKVAQTEEKRAQYRYQMAENRVRSEVHNAFFAFNHACEKLELFRASLVKNAKDALDQKRAEYLDGEIHLIEVLDAQRSYDEVLSSFFSAIYEKSIALVNLQSAAGIWEL